MPIWFYYLSASYRREAQLGQRCVCFRPKQWGVDGPSPVLLGFNFSFKSHQDDKSVLEYIESLPRLSWLRLHTKSQHNDDSPRAGRN